MAALVLVTCWLVPLAFPHDAGDDPLCVPELASKGTDQIGGATNSRQPDHCVVCHTARSFRSAVNETARIPVWLTAGLLIDQPVEPFRRGPAFYRLPARAPPVTTVPI